MSIRCPGSYGEFAVTITRECFGAKFQILDISYSISGFHAAPAAQSGHSRQDIPFWTSALAYRMRIKELTWFRMTFRW